VAPIRTAIENKACRSASVSSINEAGSATLTYSTWARGSDTIGSGYSLLTRSHPQVSWWGIGLAIAAAIIMPLLWQGKLRVARHIGSAALKADAVCSVTCAYMSFTLLIGLLLNTLFGFGWADSLAALALVYFIVQEGREALHEARTGETCSCGEEECS